MDFFKPSRSGVPAEVDHESVAFREVGSILGNNARLMDPSN